MKTFIILSEKKWHNGMTINLNKYFKANWIRISRKEDFIFNKIHKINPNKIFILHWSYIISSEIFKNYECILFHMTDLPYGRGGSPLQNLIVRNFKKTKISAIKVKEEIDSGDVYFKNSLTLEGTANEIFIRASTIIFEMIKKILSSNIKPIAQEGKIVKFKRRKPNQSNIIEIKDIKKIYDHIRMLDCDGYPNAFLDFGEFRIEFSNAKLINEELKSNVRIFKK